MNTTIDPTKLLRVKYKNAYEASRQSAMWAILLTFVSIILLATVGVYLFFSAYLPVSLMEMGVTAKELDSATYTDRELIEQGVADEVFEAYRAQLKEAGDTTEYSDQELFEMGVADEVIAEFRVDLKAYQEETDGMIEFVICGGLSLIISVFLLICWLLTKNNPVWMIVLTVLFALDTLIMIPDLFSYYLYEDVSAMLFLILYHAWILYALISGVIAGLKLKKLPAPIEGEAVEIVPTVDTIAIPSAEGAPTEESASAENDTTPEV